MSDRHKTISTISLQCHDDSWYYYCNIRNTLMIPNNTNWSQVCWYCLILLGTLWYCLVSFGIVWFRLVSFGIIWFHLVSFGIIWYRLVSFGIVWNCLVLFGIIWYVWYRLVMFGNVWQCYIIVWKLFQVLLVASGANLIKILL
jgi:hypothetical protein